MVVDEVDKPAEAETPTKLKASSTRISIKPLSEPGADKPAETVAATAPEAKPAKATSPEASTPETPKTETAKPAKADKKAAKTDKPVKTKTISQLAEEATARQAAAQAEEQKSTTAAEPVAAAVAAEPVKPAEAETATKPETADKPEQPTASKTDQTTTPTEEPSISDSLPTDDEAETDGESKATGQDQQTVEAAAKAEAEKVALHDAEIQKLVDSKQYYLPINAVEKRRSKRVVALGIFLSLILAAAWLDIALDAGLVQLDSVKPVTHFFSN